MNNLSQHDIEFLISRLQNGETIPEDYKYRLFPVTHKEYELAYGGKMRKEDILAGEDGVHPAPLQIEKVFNGEREAYPDGWQNMIVFGDNLQFLKTVYANEDPLIKDKIKGKVKLIYIDPPFGTGDEYDGNKGQRGYTAKTKGAEFVEFVRRRLIVAKEILADNGCIFVRLDHHFGHYVKLVLDEVFGKENFQNEFIVNRIRKNVTNQGKQSIPTANDSLYLYFKSQLSSLEDISKKLPYLKEGYWHAMDSSGIRYPPERIFFGKVMLPPNGRHWTFTQEKIDIKIKDGKLRLNPKSGKPEYWIEPKDTVTLDTNWTDISGYTFTTDYPTENSELLLDRVIRCASRPGDLILDFFGGSGTTAAVAEKLGRRWITCDIGKLSFYTIQKRLLNIGNSKDTNNSQLRYGKKSKSFITINIGYYNFEEVFKLQPSGYSRFVMDLFEVEPLADKKIGGITISGQKKDGYFCLIYPYWEFPDALVDIDYLDDLHAHIGGKVGNRFYIVAPANSVDFVSDYYDAGTVKYYFLKVPYHIIRELHKVQFKKFRQPQSKSKVNELDDAVGFHFMRQPEVESKLILKDDKVSLHINTFLSKFSEEESGKELQNFESLSMILIDRNYNGKEFQMTDSFFASDLLPKKKKKVEENESLDMFQEQLREQKNIIIPPFPRSACGDKLFVIYIDFYGNEFKEELTIVWA